MEGNAIDIEEKRRARRRTVREVVPVIDLMTDRSLGTLGNISAEGLMIISQEALGEGDIFQLSFQLSGGDAFEIGAQALWSSPARSGNVHWNGMRIIDIDPADAERLRIHVESA